MPSKVTFGDGSTIVYTYAADGTKLRTVHTISGTSTQKDYCANVVYENGVQKMLLTEEGYVDLSNSSYYYYLKDHQGNNRVVVSSGGTVAEVNHYYPFGGVFASSGNVQPYKYNGKELDTKKGLNWYDYGARHYDAALGRWLVVDPLAEKMSAWSPYSYCYNSPVKLVDEGGESPKVYKALYNVGKRAYKTYKQSGNFNLKKAFKDELVDIVEKFLGKGYKEIDGTGRFVSKDGTRVFRMGKNDIEGKHGGGSHVNFEILEPNSDKPGKMKVSKNLHIYINDEK